MISCGAPRSTRALVPRKAAVSSTPSASTTPSASAPITSAGGAVASHVARPTASAWRDGSALLKSERLMPHLESAAKRATCASTSSSPISSSKKSRLATEEERAASLKAKPRTRSHAAAGERRTKRSVIALLPDGGTEQSRTAAEAAWPASRYLRTEAPPKEWPIRTGGPADKAARGPSTKAARSDTCSSILTERWRQLLVGEPLVPRSETAWHSQPSEAAKRPIQRSQHHAP
mmetsp:Transcript_35715/g.112111  ORF Transcript_35715/g.112111 Transcript_35715/m.112111 type:complete len:233 (-) Transcript_35715:73-771(-)